MPAGVPSSIPATRPSPPRPANDQRRDSRYANAVETTVAIARAVTGFSRNTVSFRL
ncbi:hypothetical protein RAM_39060 [Amycolatopsis mediterranei S699]|uniref:Uncharacterized protein n=1 Tax=Amycolatopsis mediterranei (strain S699) TaxID=713604 RepID=A0A9R0P4X0_AMYMS|nr:hypothetical protein RAM_39060 [Amycolatopsis mediterranei S699]